MHPLAFDLSKYTIPIKEKYFDERLVTSFWTIFGYDNILAPTLADIVTSADGLDIFTNVPLEKAKAIVKLQNKFQRELIELVNS